MCEKHRLRPEKSQKDKSCHMCEQKEIIAMVEKHIFHGANNKVVVVNKKMLPWFKQ